MEKVSAFANKRIVRFVVVALVAGVLVINYVAHRGWEEVTDAGVRHMESAVSHAGWAPHSDYDLVFALYSEPLETLNETVTAVQAALPSGSISRVIVYNKGGEHTSEQLLSKLPIDEVVNLPNIGREGETYLNHIIRHYPNPMQFAQHTLFLQPHLAWGPWTFLPRLPLLHKRTGFLSFGPYHTQQCGHDDQGNDFPRMKNIYESFREKECPMDHPQLSTWAGQFAVSRTRILSNSLGKYQSLSALFHAPLDDPIWSEGWGNNAPSNPTLGHALERTWPVIFGCEDPIIAEQCGDQAKGTDGWGRGCQCLDGKPQLGLLPSGED